MEYAVCEPLHHSKEKYVFVIRTFDKSIYKEKNYILKAKSTMDMNGWVFSINTQAFMCTENKKIYDYGQDLLKLEQKNAEILQDKAFKAFKNFEDLLENQKIRDFFLKKSREKEFFQKLFRYLVDLLDLYFRIKNYRKESIINEVSFISQETLFKTLEFAFLNQNNEQMKEKKQIYLPQDFPAELSNLLGLELLFQNKFDSFQNKNFWESFENIIKPKILDNLKRSKEVSKILIDILSNFNSHSSSFRKPQIIDLTVGKIKEIAFLGLPKKSIKGGSQNSSPKNSMKIVSNPLFSDINN